MSPMGAINSSNNSKEYIYLLMNPESEQKAKASQEAPEQTVGVEADWMKDSSGAKGQPEVIDAPEQNIIGGESTKGDGGDG